MKKFVKTGYNYNITETDSNIFHVENYNDICLLYSLSFVHMQRKSLFVIQYTGSKRNIKIQCLIPNCISSCHGG